MKLTAEKSALNGKYQSLKEEIRDMETVRKYAEEIQRDIAPPRKERTQWKELDR